MRGGRVGGTGVVVKSPKANLGQDQLDTKLNKLIDVRLKLDLSSGMGSLLLARDRGMNANKTNALNISFDKIFQNFYKLIKLFSQTLTESK